MNEKVTMELISVETGEVREFTGYWDWKEIYLMVKNYEKSKKWKIKKIEKELQQL